MSETDDSGWDLINGPVADEIEEVNRTSLMCVAAAMTKSMLAQRDNSVSPIPDAAALRILHRAATLFLMKHPGRYRDYDMHVEEGGQIVFRAQPWQEVRPHMRDFFRRLRILWGEGDALDVAAFALWRLTWIHPFGDGNGRTALAFAYVCLCLKLGAWLPGDRTIVRQFAQDRDASRDLLRAADRSCEATGAAPDLSALKSYLDSLLLNQIRSAESDPR